MSENKPETPQDNGESQYINEDNLGALAALRRAAIKARRRALEVSGSVLIRKDGEFVYESDPNVLFPDGADYQPSPTPETTSPTKSPSEHPNPSDGEPLGG